MSLHRVCSIAIVRLRAGLRAAFPAVKQEDLFPYDLIVHFSYHKCLTVYYLSIVRPLGSKFAFSYEHYNTDYDRFEEAALRKKGKRVLSLSDRSDIDWPSLREYRGSHFVRDPRDLVVSGYYYHLWTEEKWCNNPEFGWNRITEHPYYSQYVESREERHPRNVSYKEYLNTLDKETGLIVETIFRDKHFSEMYKWNYENPRILELKYEEIIGNEGDCFRKLFEHYGFHPKLVDSGVEIAERLSLKHRVKSNTGHVRNGTPRQWRKEFSPLVKNLFKEAHGDLLIRLGYEKDVNW